MLGVSLAAWLLVVPIRALAENYDAAVPAFFEGIAVTLFVAGLQGTFLNMIPLSFMDGQKIWRWRKVAWAGLTIATALLFWHVLINSDQSYLRALSSTVSAAAFGILSGVRRAERRRVAVLPQAEVADGRRRTIAANQGPGL